MTSPVFPAIASRGSTRAPASIGGRGAEDNLFVQVRKGVVCIQCRALSSRAGVVSQDFEISAAVNWGF